MRPAVTPEEPSVAASAAADGHRGSSGTGSSASAALGWSFANTMLGKVGTLGIGIVLARLLGPEEFGTYAVAFVALVAALSFNELGVSLAVVRWPGDPRAIAPTVSTISLVTSGALTAGLFLGAPAFAAAMGDADAAPVVELLSLSILISGAVATPAALLQREFRQRTRAVIDQTSIWVGAVTSIALALGGAGAMSLAVGRVAGSLLAAVLFIRWSPLPYRLGLDRTHVGGLLAFGMPLAGASMLMFAVSYADQILVGALLGPVALGFYVLAFNLSSWPVAMFSQPLRSVAPAAFARLQHQPESMRSTFVSLVGLLAAIAFPVCFLLSGSAGPLVRLVYGAAWTPAADALTWLALLAACKIVFELVYDYLVVLGASVNLLVVQCAGLAALVPAVAVGATAAGISGAAAAQVLVAVVVLLPFYAVQLGRRGIRVAGLASRLSLPTVVGLAVALTGMTAEQHLSSGLGVVLLTGTLAATAAVCLVLRDREHVGRLRATARSGARAPEEAAR